MIPSFADSFEVLCLQIAADGRGPVLFGDSVDRAREAGRPFMVGEEFPSVYLEFPLSGEPFLDVTLLYSKLDSGTRIDSPAASGSEDMLDWYASACAGYEHVNVGFELDTGKPELPAAAVHFQPRMHTELVEPFCEVIGEPERAKLYLDLAARMPEGWELSFFGLFRGRPGSPLRVCGYLAADVKAACAENPAELAAVFDKVGFSAYDDAMLAQVSELMAIAPGGIDFQLDIYPDGPLGDAFAFDVQFEIEQPWAVEENFSSGPGARVMETLAKWGAADERWKLAAGAAFARAIPLPTEDGELKRYSFTVIPQWLKARWRAGVLQPSKLYYLGGAGFLES